MPIYSYISICLHFECLDFISLLSWITTTSLPWLCLGKAWWAKALQSLSLFWGLFIYLVSCLAPPSFLALLTVPLSLMLYPYPYMFGFFPCSSNSNLPLLFPVFFLLTLWTPLLGLTSFPTHPVCRFPLWITCSCACNGSTDAFPTTTPDVHWKQRHGEENSAGTHHSCHMSQLQVETLVRLDPSPPFARLEPREQQLLLMAAEVLGGEVSSSGSAQQPRESPFTPGGNRTAQPGVAPWLVRERCLSHPCAKAVPQSKLSMTGSTLTLAVKSTAAPRFNSNVATLIFP